MLNKNYQNYVIGPLRQYLDIYSSRKLLCVNNVLHWCQQEHIRAQLCQLNGTTYLRRGHVFVIKCELVQLK